MKLISYYNDDYLGINTAQYPRKAHLSQYLNKDSYEVEI